MIRDSRRVQLTPGYLLHQRPYRDTSLIVELYTREHGRLGCFARAARGARPGTRFIGLQPFRPMLFSWSGRGESPQLTAAEPDGVASAMPPDRLLSAFYLNELMLKLTVPHDPHPELHDCYQRALTRLATDAIVDAGLRQFEKELLELLGYGVDLGSCANDGAPVTGDGYYRLQAGVGLLASEAGETGATPGHVLLALVEGSPLESAEDLRLARALMRQALDQCLEGRELATRRVARAVARVGRVA